MDAGVIDVWMQRPTLRQLQNEMFDSLRRWLGANMPAAVLPLDVTIRAMDEAGVAVGLTAAWYGPTGDLVRNDEVADYVGKYPTRLRGVAGADLRKPMDAVRELRRRVDDGFVALRIVP